MCGLGTPSTTRRVFSSPKSWCAGVHLNKLLVQALVLTEVALAEASTEVASAGTSSDANSVGSTSVVSVSARCSGLLSMRFCLSGGSAPTESTMAFIASTPTVVAVLLLAMSTSPSSTYSSCEAQFWTSARSVTQAASAEAPSTHMASAESTRVDSPSPRGDCKRSMQLGLCKGSTDTTAPSAGRVIDTLLAMCGLGTPSTTRRVFSSPKSWCAGVHLNKLLVQALVLTEVALAEASTEVASAGTSSDANSVGSTSVVSVSARCSGLLSMRFCLSGGSAPTESTMAFIASTPTVVAVLLLAMSTSPSSTYSSCEAQFWTSARSVTQAASAEAPSTHMASAESTRVDSPSPRGDCKRSMQLGLCKGSTDTTEQSAGGVIAALLALCSLGLASTI